MHARRPPLLLDAHRAAEHQSAPSFLYRGRCETLHERFRSADASRRAQSTGTTWTATRGGAPISMRRSPDAGATKKTRSQSPLHAAPCIAFASQAATLQTFIRISDVGVDLCRSIRSRPLPARAQPPPSVVLCSRRRDESRRVDARPCHRCGSAPSCTRTASASKVGLSALHIPNSRHAHRTASADAPGDSPDEELCSSHVRASASTSTALSGSFRRSLA